MSEYQSKKYFVAGGAGFIGSHLVNYLLDKTDGTVTVYDNFRTGQRWHYGYRLESSRLNVIEADVKDLDDLTKAMEGHDVVYHLAANSDIASAAEEPDVDFWLGTYLTHNILEAMRKNGLKRILFPSGSGVYGEVDPKPVPENYDKMIPISTYGASKLASEGLISAYAHMFDIRGTVFRFANVVGDYQTHGVSYDFIRRLADAPEALTIYGDGTQTKPYVHVEDVVNAFQMLEVKQEELYEVFNVGTNDYLTVHEIADIVVAKMELKDVQYNFTGGKRGWKADVPVYSLDTSKIHSRGWLCRRNSRQAVESSVEAIIGNLKAGKFEERV